MDQRLAHVESVVQELTQKVTALNQEINTLKQENSNLKSTISAGIIMG
jgi:hypothetical protein